MVQRQKEINDFVPEIYYEVEVTYMKILKEFGLIKRNRNKNKKIETSRRNY